MARRKYRPIPSVRQLASQLRGVFRRVRADCRPLLLADGEPLPPAIASRMKPSLTLEERFEMFTDGVQEMLTTGFAAKGWDFDHALRAMNLHLVPCLTLPGREQAAGRAGGRHISVHPQARDPLAVCLHECAHVLLGHTAAVADRRYEAGTAARTADQECEAEAVAWICSEALRTGREGQHISYIWSWGAGNIGPHVFTAEVVKRIRAVAIQILDAGQTGEITHEAL